MRGLILNTFRGYFPKNILKIFILTLCLGFSACIGQTMESGKGELSPLGTNAVAANGDDDGALQQNSGGPAERPAVASDIWPTDDARLVLKPYNPDEPPCNPQYQVHCQAMQDHGSVLGNLDREEIEKLKEHTGFSDGASIPCEMTRQEYVEIDYQGLIMAFNGEEE